MKKIRKITAPSKQHLKFCAFVVAVVTCFCLVTATSLQPSQYVLPTIDGAPLIWQGRNMTSYMVRKNSLGYTDRYTDKPIFCDSSLFIPGVTLLGETFMGVCLIILVIYLFIGLMVVSDLTMDAVHEITSATETIIMKDDQGKEVVIESPIWNVYVAQLTLVALASAAPEIFLCYYSYFGEGAEWGNATPLGIGPIAVVGSAAVNLLIVCGIVIASTRVLRIKRIGIFSMVCLFSIFAYVWMLLVVRFITPAKVSFTEGIITLLFYPMMILLVWVTDLCTHEPLSPERQARELTRRHTKNLLMQIAKAKSPEYVINMATGNLPPYGSFEDMDRIRNYYKACLGVNDLRGVSLEEYIQVLEPESVIDRLRTRKQVNAGNQPHSNNFGKIHHSELMIADEFNLNKVYSPVGFKSTTYSVCENAGYVRLTVEKRIPGDFTFKVVTQDDTAKAGSDYVGIDQLYTLKKEDKEKEIVIRIFDDPQVEFDEEFKVILIHKDNGTQLPGEDTCAIVTIIDNDHGGVIGFEDRVIKTMPAQGRLKVTLNRADGTGGDAVVHVTTSVQSPLMNEFQRAVRGIDYDHFQNKEVFFYECQNTATFEVVLPNSSLRDNLGNIPKKCDPICLVLQLSDARPEKVSLSKRKECLVRIEPDTEAWKKYDQRMQILRLTLQARNPEWYDQFRLACCLSPSIDECDAVEEVTYGKAFIHLITMPWKIIFGVIPPRRFLGGWLALIFAVACTCGLVYIIMEVIRNIICMLGISPQFIGLVVFAVLTAVPEIMTSYRLMDNKDIEDAGDIFNPILASNAVNVFVGLGLPWTISTIFQWSLNNKDVLLGPQTGYLAWGALTFVIAAVLAILCLGCKRCCWRAEIGGKCSIVCSFFFFLLWALFIASNMVSFSDVIIDPGVVLSDTCQGLNAPITANTGEFIQVSFSMPQGFTEVETSFRFKGGEQDWQDITHDCSEIDFSYDPPRLWCAHEYFRWGEDPDCKPLEVRVRSCREDGGCCTENENGPWSPISQQGTIVQGLPKPYELRLAEQAKDANKIAIGWDSQDSQTCDMVLGYQLEIKKSGDAWRDVYPRSENYMGLSRTIRNLDQCTTYEFRGRVITDAKYEGLFSPYLTVTTLCDDCNPGPIVTKMRNCMVEIDWSTCYQCADHLHSSHYNGKFLVEAQNRRGEYSAMDECGNYPGTKKCTVSLNDLQDMDDGARIVARVHPLTEDGNKIGKYSQPSNATVYYTVMPAHVRNLHFSNVTQSTATLHWAITTTTDVFEYQIWASSEQNNIYNLHGKVHNRLQNQVVVSGLNSETTYSFKLVPVNECADSGLINAQVVTITTLQGLCSHGKCTEVIENQPPVIDILLNDCNVDIDISGVEDMTDVNLQIHGADYVYHDKNLPIIANAKMSVRMEVLANPPYNLKGGDLIMVRAQALGKNEWTPWSQPSERSFVAMKSPQAPSLPFARWTDVDMSAVVISWGQNSRLDVEGDPFSPDIEYQLQWDAGTLDGNSETWTQIYRGPEPSFRIFAIDFGLQYKFKVRTVDKCGNSEWSGEYCLFTPPAPPQNPTCKGDCMLENLHLQWESVQMDGGSYITSYKVYIKDRQGADQEYHCRNVNAPECMIDYADLTKGSFRLVPGDQILVSIQAVNQIGPSLKKQVDNCRNSDGTQVTLEVAPCKIPMPVAGDIIGNVVPISWQPCSRQKYGASIMYKLEWDQGMNNQNWYEIVTTPGQYSTRFEISSLETDYSFRVTGSNRCGSERSPALIIKPWHVPDVGCPIVSVFECVVHISWKTESTGSGNIGESNLDYELKVMTSRGDWKEFSLSICRENNSKLGTQHYDPSHYPGDDFRCTIPMAQLMNAPYFLEGKAEVLAAVRAKNELGWSVEKLDCPCFAYMKTPPSKYIAKPWIKYQTKDSVTVSYKECPGNDVSTYLLKEELDGTWNRVHQQQQLREYSMDTTLGATNRFKLECKNECGIEPGPPLVIEVPDCPLPPVCQLKYAPECSVLIEWYKNPDDINPAIEKFQVSINGHTYQPCSHTNQQDCKVHMKTLMTAPFFLKVGDNIKCTVSAANAQGWSEWSEERSSAVFVRGPPATPPAPFEDNEHRSDRKIHVCLRKSDQKSMVSATAKHDHANSVAIAGSMQSQLYLWTNHGTGMDQKNNFVQIHEHKAGQCHRYRYNKKKNYKVCKKFAFFVREKNECGYTDSLPTIIEIPAPPGPPIAWLKREACTAILEWEDPPNDGCSRITHYELAATSEFYRSDTTRDFDLVTRAFEGRDCIQEEMRHQRKCIFTMEEIESKAKTKYGEKIRIFIRACNRVTNNDNNCGEWSEEPSDNIPLQRVPYPVTGIDTLEPDDQSELIFEWQSCNDGSSETAPIGCYFRVRLFKDGVPEGRTEIVQVQNRFVKYSPILGCKYKLEVRVCNLCGCSNEVGEHKRVCSEPEAPRPTCTYEGCAVRVYWRYPQDNGCPITKYRLQIQDQQVDNKCLEKFHRNFDCLFKMHHLEKAPYVITEGHEVNFKAFAINKIGTSKASGVCRPELKRLGPPPQLSGETIVEANQRIKVCVWPLTETVDDSLEYQYYWDNGHSHQEPTYWLTQTTNRCFLVPTLGDRSKYKFRVVANNVCGESHVDLTQSVCVCPTRPNCVLSLLDNCAVLVKWGVPFDGRCPIQDYQLQVETPPQSGQYEDIDCNQVPNEKVITCQVSMQTLKSRPYNLKDGQLIHMRVRAKNEVGWSEWANRSVQTVTVMAPPPAMTAPKANIAAVGLDGKSGRFTVCWENLFFQQNTQASLQPSYDMRWGVKQQVRPSRLEEGTNTARTCISRNVQMLPSVLTAGRDPLPYRFAVRARNACGVGPWSEITTCRWPKVLCQPGEKCHHGVDPHTHAASAFQRAKEIEIDEPVKLKPVPLEEGDRWSPPPPRPPSPGRVVTDPTTPATENKCWERNKPSIPCTPCNGGNNDVLLCSSSCMCSDNNSDTFLHDDEVTLLLGTNSDQGASSSLKASGTTKSSIPTWRAVLKKKNSPRAVSTTTSTHT